MKAHPGESLKRGLIPDWLDKLFLHSVTPLIRFFSYYKLNPNYVTIAGFLLNLIAGIMIFSGHFLNAAILVGVAGIFDFIDGKIASATGQVTCFGAVLDSMLDRYSDFAIYSGIAGLFIVQNMRLPALAVFFAMAGSFITSYARAIGASNGFKFRTGIIRRQERITIIFVALLLAGLNYKIDGLFAGSMAITKFIKYAIPVWPLSLSIYFLAILTNITAIQRLMMIRKMTSQNTQKIGAGF